VFHDGGPLGLLFAVLSGALSLAAGIVTLVLVLGVLFLLVRFLWFGTRAAQLYLVKNGESARFSWPPRRFEEPAAPRRPMTPPSP